MVAGPFRPVGSLAGRHGLDVSTQEQALPICLGGRAFGDRLFELAFEAIAPIAGRADGRIPGGSSNVVPPERSSISAECAIEDPNHPENLVAPDPEPRLNSQPSMASRASFMQLRSLPTSSRLHLMTTDRVSASAFISSAEGVNPVLGHEDRSPIYCARVFDHHDSILPGGRSAGADGWDDRAKRVPHARFCGSVLRLGSAGPLPDRSVDRSPRLTDAHPRPTAVAARMIE